MKSNHKPGERVNIYADPFQKAGLEGSAILVKLLRQCGSVEEWKVRFYDDDHNPSILFIRWIGAAQPRGSSFVPYKRDENIIVGIAKENAKYEVSCSGRKRIMHDVLCICGTENQFYHTSWIQGKKFMQCKGCLRKIEYKTLLVLEDPKWKKRKYAAEYRARNKKQ